MDFSSAFNTIQVNLLLECLFNLHVHASLIMWIKEFLTNRPQRVNVSGHLSDEVILNSGVPQGCVLSPTLFSIYTN